MPATPKRTADLEHEARLLWAAKVSAEALAPDEATLQKILERVILRMFQRLELEAVLTLLRGA